MSELVKLEREGAVAWIWLERPDVHNAFNDEVVARLDESIREVVQSDCRVLVLGGRGKSFSAGADLNWMKSKGQSGDSENREDAGRLAAMLRVLSSAPQATIARVQGTALGGGLGLIAACDLAIAVERAKFGFSEVRLGLIPAVISPHAIEKIGPGRARHLFVTGERFDAADAERYGLISQVVPDEEALDLAVDAAVSQVLQNGPQAVAAAKELIRQVTSLPLSEVDAYTSAQIAARRASEEGREGITAFLHKRSPSWQAPH